MDDTRLVSLDPDLEALRDLRTRVEDLMAAMCGRYQPAVHRLALLDRIGADELEDQLRRTRLDGSPGMLLAIYRAATTVLGAE